MAAVGVLAAVVLIVAIAGGIGPFAGDDGDIQDSPTATSTPLEVTENGGGSDGGVTDGGADGGDGGDDSPGGGQTTAEPTPQQPFDMQIESIESCGQTCRDVTATLENQQDQQATGVTVHTRIHEGNGTDGDVVWEGTHEVGTLGAGEADTETQRVELSYFDAYEIQQNGGWITIVTSIDTDRRTVTFQERWDVT